MWFGGEGGGGGWRDAFMGREKYPKNKQNLFGGGGGGGEFKT